jgi:hypothetical integral membrane protein (TIGR02206 family)
METFFKRIPPGGLAEFEKFTVTHLITVIFVVIIIFLSIKFFKKIKQGKMERVIRYSIGIFMLISNISIYLYAYNYNLAWYHYLPEATCGWAIYFGGIMMLTKNRTMFVLTLYWGYGAILTMMGSNVLEGLGRYNFYQYQLRHILIVIAPIYMIIVHNYKIEKKDFKTYFFITITLVIIGGIISKIVNQPESFNMFYMLKPGMDGTPLSWMFEINYYLYVIVWLAFAALLGYLYGLIFQSKNTINE